MSQAFAAGNKARGFCDRCGFNYLLHDLHPQVIDMVTTGLLVCPECLDEDQPQLQLGRWPVDDPQALRNARPAGQEAGRNENAISYDFDTDADGFTGINTAVTYDATDQSIIVTSDGSGTDSDPARFIKSDTVINTALYRYCRMRMKINTMPDDVDNWIGEFWWKHSGVTAWYGPVSIGPPDWFVSGDPYHDLSWDMLGESQHPQWDSTVLEIRFDLWGTPTDTSGVIEVDYIRFEGAGLEPPPEVKNGVTNYSFESPMVFPLQYTSQQGDIEPIPGWLVAGEPLVYSTGGNMGVYRPAASDLVPVNGVNIAYSDPASSGEDRSFSQVTDNVLSANTRYTLNVSVGRRNAYPDPILYEVRLKADGVTLATESSLSPAQLQFLTSSITLDIGSTHAQMGKAIEIELVQNGTKGSNGQIAWDNVLLTSEPYMLMDFLVGTVTNAFRNAIEGWWSLTDTYPSITWDGTNKTVLLDNQQDLTTIYPQFLHWDYYGGGGSLDIDTSRFNVIRVRMRVTDFGTDTSDSWKGTAFWGVTDASLQLPYPFGVGGQSLTIESPNFVESGDPWHELTWEVGSNPAWNNAGTVTSLRFDFFNYTSTTTTKKIIEVDWIKLQGS